MSKFSLKLKTQGLDSAWTSRKHGTWNTTNGGIWPNDRNRGEKSIENRQKKKKKKAVPVAT